MNPNWSHLNIAQEKANPDSVLSFYKKTHPAKEK
ncbi:hypothetical protein [Amylolactobacillus amylophilus]